MKFILGFFISLNTKNSTTIILVLLLVFHIIGNLVILLIFLIIVVLFLLLVFHAVVFVRWNLEEDGGFQWTIEKVEFRRRCRIGDGGFDNGKGGF